MKYRVGARVRVRSLQEIRATLDDKGCLDGLPFMREMEAHSGQVFRVSSVAHKTCDTVNHSGGRRMHAAVHLDELRCNGQAHGGCQAACLYFWKLEWLELLDPADAIQASDQQSSGRAGSDTNDVNLDIADGPTREQGARYVCQATQLYAATSALHWWDLRQYWRDWRSGNAKPGKIFETLILAGLYSLKSLPIGYRLNSWLYDRAHRLFRGGEAPQGEGSVPSGQRTPDRRLDLQAGEWVEVRSLQAIRDTLSRDNKNRGLSFDVEMARFTGKRFRVAARIQKIINEQTGEMMRLENPCIVLEDVYCLAEYSHCRLLCPRRITPYWRELWLQRVGGDPDDEGRASLSGS